MTRECRTRGGAAAAMALLLLLAPFTTHCHRLEGAVTPPSPSALPAPPNVTELLEAFTRMNDELHRKLSTLLAARNQTDVTELILSSEANLTPPEPLREPLLGKDLAGQRHATPPLPPGAPLRQQQQQAAPLPTTTISAQHMVADLACPTGGTNVVNVNSVADLLAAKVSGRTYVLQPGVYDVPTGSALSMSATTPQDVTCFIGVGPGQVAVNGLLFEYTSGGGAVGFRGMTWDGKGTTQGMTFNSAVSAQLRTEDFVVANSFADGLSGSGMYLGQGIDARLVRTSFRNCTSLSGGAIALYDASSLTLEQCDLEGNSVAQFGGAILAQPGTISVVGPGVSRFTGNRARRGGAIALYAGSQFNATGQVVLKNNSALFFGGGIFAQDTGTSISASGATWDGNAAGLYGGGILTFDAALTLEECSLTNNAASLGGGVLAIRGGMWVSGTVWGGNTAALNGGAVLASGTSITVASSTWTGNDAAQDGGGIYAEFVTMTLQQAAFLNNSCARQGGALYMRDATVDLTGPTTWRGNTAAAGGAIYVDVYAQFSQDARLCATRNNAGSAGGFMATRSASSVAFNAPALASIALNTPEDLFAADADATVTSANIEGAWPPGNYNITGRVVDCARVDASGAVTCAGCPLGWQDSLCTCKAWCVSSGCCSDPLTPKPGVKYCLWPNPPLAAEALAAQPQAMTVTNVDAATAAKRLAAKHQEQQQAGVASSKGIKAWPACEGQCNAGSCDLVQQQYLPRGCCYTGPDPSHSPYVAAASYGRGRDGGGNDRADYYCWGSASSHNGEGYGGYEYERE